MSQRRWAPVITTSFLPALLILARAPVSLKKQGTRRGWKNELLALRQVSIKIEGGEVTARPPSAPLGLNSRRMTRSGARPQTHAPTAAPHVGKSTTLHPEQAHAPHRAHPAAHSRHTRDAQRGHGSTGFIAPQRAQSTQTPAGREGAVNTTGRATSLHLPVRDRAPLPEQPLGGGKARWERGEKKKKLSKRQLANAARAKHRGSFFDQLMRALDPASFSRSTN